MSKAKSERSQQPPRRNRRQFTEEFKAEAVQMLLDGHSASSICQRLGLSSPNILYRCKRELIRRGGSAYHIQTQLGRQAALEEFLSALNADSPAVQSDADAEMARRAKEAGIALEELGC